MAKKHRITIPKKILADKSVTKIHANDLPKKRSYRYKTNVFTDIPPCDEHQLQTQCHNFIKEKYPTLMSYAIPNGAKTQVSITKTGKEINFERMWLVEEGLTSGVADYFVCKAVRTSNTKSGWYHGLYIEFKFGENTQSKEQIAFEIAVTAEDYLYVTVYENTKPNFSGIIDPLYHFKLAFLGYMDKA